MFEGLIKLTEKIEITSQTVSFMHLWYNQTFKIGGNSFFFKNYFDRGIQCVGDFIDQNGSLYLFDMFMQKWNVRTNCVHYNSIHSSITRVIRVYKFILPFSYEMVRPFRPQIIKVICCSKTGCRPIYDVLNVNDFHRKSQNKWITELNLKDNFGWKFVFDLPFYLTKDSKLQWFQFKIVHRIIGTNHLLSKMGLKDYCSFCYQYPETSVHLF